MGTFGIVVSAAAAVAVAFSAQAATLALSTDPDPAVIVLGDDVEVSLVTSSDFGSFTGVNIDVTFDAAVLRYETTKFSPVFDFLQMPQAQAVGATGPGTSVQNITAATFFGSGSGEEVLATLTFAAIGTGSSGVSVAGTGGELVVGPDGAVDTALLANVQVVPLPAAGWMFAAALASLGAVAQKRRHSR